MCVFLILAFSDPQTIPPTLRPTLAAPRPTAGLRCLFLRFPGAFRHVQERLPAPDLLGVFGHASCVKVPGLSCCNIYSRFMKAAAYSETLMRHTAHIENILTSKSCSSAPILLIPSPLLHKTGVSSCFLKICRRSMQRSSASHFKSTDNMLNHVAWVL